MALSLEIVLNWLLVLFAALTVGLMVFGVFSSRE